MPKAAKDKDKNASALSPRQKQFCVEYASDPNATKAALAAGYSEKTAYSQGNRLLKNVEILNEIEKLRRRREKRLELTQDEWLRQLWKFAMADMTDFVQWDETGKARYKPSDQIDGTMIEEFTESVIGNQSIKTLKIPKRMKAFELIGRAQGYFERSKDGPGGGNGLLEQLVNAVQQSTQALDGGEDDE